MLKVEKNLKIIILKKFWKKTDFQESFIVKKFWEKCEVFMRETKKKKKEEKLPNKFWKTVKKLRQNFKKILEQFRNFTKFD